MEPLSGSKLYRYVFVMKRVDKSRSEDADQFGKKSRENCFIEHSPVSIVLYSPVLAIDWLLNKYCFNQLKRNTALIFHFSKVTSDRLMSVFKPQRSKTDRIPYAEKVHISLHICTTCVMLYSYNSSILKESRILAFRSGFPLPARETPIGMRWCATLWEHSCPHMS